ncbi:endoribonuclease L-PSP, putative [Halobacteroides halobius DSM 5150]|uniref:Endoribonuclease L-PSP, putative n=1 Tax=Halobacteroides halobius (strain ATCC 35273 / DSM 5150 / MD-1) TaxID=748449 RepID=L0K9G3_HALHC|nr:RidA family protein [Halobacteroides halobius]AGB40999.1 endoribonuclease L-PSP, putative [Halobacteroides halobius DSM 5150]
MEEKAVITTDESPAAVGPYSQAIKYNGFVITSGQIPFTKDGELISDDIQEQTKQSLKNIENILTEVGSGVDQLIKCTIFISDMDDFSKVNQVYKDYLKKPYPARSCVEVSRLPKDVKIEIEAIASYED